MATIDLRLFIAAPPEVVWDVLADLDHQKAWMVDVRRLEIVSEQKRGTGTTMNVTSELFGVPVVKDVMLITAWEPPSLLAVEHRGAFTGSGEFALERVDNGTIFTWIERFRPPLGPIGEAGFALVVGPHLRRVFGRSMANVKRLAEARAAATATPPDSIR